MRDDGDDRDDEPTFPIAVKLAGTVWIAFGALEWVAAVLVLGQAGANAGAGAPAQPVAPCCPGLVGLAFLVCGYQTVAGKAKDTLGNGIGSLVLGLLQVVVGVVAGALGLGANDDKAARLAVIGGVFGLVGIGLIAAGVLALSGRRAYRDWRQSQRVSRRLDDYDDDDDDDYERRPRRRQR